MTTLKLSIVFAMLSLSVAVCQAKNIETLKNENVPITLKAGAQQSGEDRSSSMLVTINGEILTITFIEPLGRVTIIIEDSSGAPVEFEHGETPNGFMYYITTPGTYTLRIILSNGDEYAGVFQVTE